MLNLHGISREAFDLIVNEEVSSREVYERKYVHPEKPGGASGVTIGIGYDCGYSSAATIRRDWEGKIPHAMVEALATQAAGIKGDAAFGPCQRLKGIVSVPWEAAIDVFSNVSIPKYMAATRNGLPNYDELPPDCKGVLLSLVYNRGASFQTAGDRYSEMRAIRVAMINRNWSAIPGLLRSMKRLWQTKSVRGVALRREHEAALFEKGLRTMRIAATAEPELEPVVEEGDDDVTASYPIEEVSYTPAPLSEPDPQVAASSSAQPLNVQPVKAPYNLETEIVQRKLDRLGYHDVGEIDGRWGGKVKGALTAFLNDRGRSDVMVNGGLTPEINKAISDALSEGWTRPIAASRASATEKDLAPKVESVRQNLWQRFTAKIATIGGGIGAVASGASSNLDNANSYLTPVKQFFADTPGWVWFALAALVGALIWSLANKSVKATVTDYNTGKLN